MARYSGIAIFLHWVMAVLIPCGFGLGLVMVDLDFSPRKLALFSYHKWIGVSAFCLVAARLAWRIAHPPPALPANLPRWQAHAAGAVHVLLYLLMIAVPLSGWTYSSASGVPTVPFGLSALTLPDLVPRDRELALLLRFVHHWLNYGFAALVGLHVLAALGHRLIDHHGVLSRMLPARNP